MKTIGGVLLLATLNFGSGCAKSDWIERTLVTVDVTGTWSGTSPGGAGGTSGSGGALAAGVGGTLWFELEQQGSTVKGNARYLGTANLALPSESSLDGTVAGDVFRFKLRPGSVEGELTVSGDEMTGEVWMGTFRRLSLRRVDPSSRPAAQPR